MAFNRPFHLPQILPLFLLAAITLSFGAFAQRADDPSVHVYRGASPAVVHIGITGRSMEFYFGLIPFEATGTGSLISPDGYILTNGHVVADATEINVTLPNGNVYPARFVGEDGEHDIALVKITPEPGESFPFLKLGNSDSLRIGQKVYAIGNPYGLKSTFTSGVVSSLRRRVKVDHDETMENVIQTDAAINPGNSGGPLLDAYGRIIGVNTAIYSPSGGSDGIGFAIPANTARRIVDDLKTYGRVIRPFLGVKIGTELNPHLAKILGLSTVRGLLVGDIKANSPAERAGLKGGTHHQESGDRKLLVGGDIIVGIDGRPAFSAVQFIDYIESRRVGDTIRLKYIRNGNPYTVNITLVEKTREKTRKLTP